MNPNRENFFVSEPATRRGVEAGLTWVYEWGDLTEDGIIVLPVKRQFQGTQFSDVIGAAASKALGLGKRVRAPNGRMLRGYSMRTFPQYSDLGVVLALWVGTKSLDKLHDAQMLPSSRQRPPGPNFAERVVCEPRMAARDRAFVGT
ncbi:MAG: hypothetical protein CMN30_03430, partial [Sandaracinus sp.]|nr:hypothetical protein [Sandaracinus sp.]